MPLYHDRELFRHVGRIPPAAIDALWVVIRGQRESGGMQPVGSPDPRGDEERKDEMRF